MSKDLRDFYDNRHDYYQVAHYDGIDLSEWREVVSFALKGGNVLDLGCGVAKYIHPLLEVGNYFGTDISFYALKTAAESHAQRGARFLLSESQWLPLKNESVDTVISFYTLEHFPDPEKSLLEILRVCKKQGRVVIVAPAWEQPASFPPSLKAKMSNFFYRAYYKMSRYLKYLWLCIDQKKYFFTTISRPGVLEDGNYKADEDTVYIVSTREVLNFFRAKGCRIILAKQLKREYRYPILRNAVYNLKTLFKNNPFRRYFGTHLFAVIEKR